MKALFFLNSFAGGGAERVCLNLARQLHKLGFDSEFITIYDSEFDYEIPDYIDIFPIGIDAKAPSFVTFFNIIRSMSKVNNFISGKKYVLISAHLQPAYLLASLTKVRKKTLYVIHSRWHQAKERKSWLYIIGLRLLLGSRKIVAVSRGLEEELVHKYKIKSKNIRTIYNPCAVSEWKSKSQSRLTHLHPRPYILVMGRIVEEKNPLLILDLYYKGKFYKNYDLIYLGRGNLESNLKHKVEVYKLQNNVFMPGFQMNPEQWLKNASLLLACSKSEGFSMNLVEALICGIPVVASDCPFGPREILIDDLSNYLINPEKKQLESISTIASALKSYPQITEKYYEKFDDELIVRTYLDEWSKWFET